MKLISLSNTPGIGWVITLNMSFYPGRECVVGGIKWAVLGPHETQRRTTTSWRVIPLAITPLALEEATEWLEHEGGTPKVISEWHYEEHKGPPATLSPEMPQAFIPGLGTVRPCRICLALVSGGVTICQHCVGNLKKQYMPRKVYQNKVDGQPPVAAVQWTKNGDHPDDDCYRVNAGDESFWSEGKVVRRFLLPEPGEKICQECGQSMDVHGLIDSPYYLDGPGSSTVCPGGFVVEVQVLERKRYYALTEKQFQDWYRVTI